MQTLSAQIIYYVVKNKMYCYCTHMWYNIENKEKHFYLGRSVTLWQQNQLTYMQE